MGRRSRDARVLGPYKDGRGWRIIAVGPDGTRRVVYCSEEVEAKRKAKALRKTAPGQKCIEQVIEMYTDMQRKRGCKEGTIKTTEYHLRAWLPVEMPIYSVTTGQIEKMYLKRTEKVSVDTHRNELREVKAFFKWAVKKRMILNSPAEPVDPIGKRARGKPQLRDSEVYLFYLKALELAQAGNEGALASLLALLLGLRSREIIKRQVRDIDSWNGQVWYWVEKGKTPTSDRKLEVHGDLAELLEMRVKGLPPDAWLFPGKTKSGHRTRDWLRDAVVRICKLAQIPRVTPHGLRGTCATIAVDEGVVTAKVAKALGHASSTVTRDHYLEGGVEERVRSRLMIEKLTEMDSGTKKSSKKDSDKEKE